MAQVINKYAASDGTEFNTEQEADAHDFALSTKDTVERYLVHAGLKGKAAAGFLRKQIPGYLAFAKAEAAQASD